MKRLVIITGLSGSGKTLAADCLEDLDYFCVDNLPVSLIPPFCKLIRSSGEHMHNAALVVDAREGAFLDSFPDILRELRKNSVPVQVLFFDCSDDVLKRRFSESRRPHPMAGPQGTLEDAINSERAALRTLRDMADRIIDTSRFTSHQLRRFLRTSYGEGAHPDAPNVNVVSFGFKYGVPAEVDLVFDVRFLPNPHFIDELRPLDGRDHRVRAFLYDVEVTEEFMARLQEFLTFLIPLYAAEGKTYLTIGIGCTGGKHRSVALSEALSKYLAEHTDVPATVSHRDLGRE